MLDAPSLQPDDNDDISYDYLPTSPVPSGVPSIISPPPPSELLSHPELINNGRPSAHRLSRQKYNIQKEDLKYMLDPVIRGQTNLGTYVEGQSLVKPFRPRGPQGLPLREPKRIPPMQLPPSVLEQIEDDLRYTKKPAFYASGFCTPVIRHS